MDGKITEYLQRNGKPVNERNRKEEGKKGGKEGKEKRMYVM